MLNVNSPELSSGPFKPEAFLPENVDPKVVNRSQHFTTQEKADLGQTVAKLQKVSKKNYSSFADTAFNRELIKAYHLQLADIYIQLAQKRRFEMVKMGLAEALEILDSENPLRIPLFKSLEKFENLCPKASQKEIKNVFDGGVSALLELEKVERDTKNTDKSSAKAPSETKTGAIFTRLIRQGALTHSYLESVRGNTEEAKKSSLAQLFHVHSIPEISENGFYLRGEQYSKNELANILATNNVEKRNFLEENFPLESLAQVISQAKSYPLMQAAVIKICRNLEEWDIFTLTDDKSGLEALQEQLKQQLKNLIAISEEVAEIITKQENHLALSLFAIPFEEVEKTFLLDLYMNGERDLSNFSDREVVADTIRKHLREIKKYLRHKAMSKKNILNPSEGNKSTALPFSAKSIRARVELQKAIREGKTWAGRQPDIKAELKSINLVFKLQKPIDEFKTAAYFKQSHGHREAAGHMERLMFDIAEILEVADHFVPTGQVRLLTQAGPSGDTLSTMVWDDGDLKKVEGTFKTYRGGIQVAINGKTLDDEINEKTEGEISIDEVAKGVVISIIFGMFDAHPGNILVVTQGFVKTNTGEILEGILQKNKEFAGELETENGERIEFILQQDGKIVRKDRLYEILYDKGELISSEKKILFFDNTRSLPHSSGFINRGVDRVRIAYRCALLNLDQSHVMLNSKSIDTLKQMVSDCKNRIKDLEKYIKNPLSMVQQRLKKIPPGWMDIEKSIAAMKDRINKLEQALASDIGLTLCELVERSNPAYRFAYALTLLKNAFKKKLSLENETSSFLARNFHNDVGLVRMETQIEAVAELDYDVEYIKGMCDNLTIPLELLIDRLREHHQEVQKGLCFFPEVLRYQKAEKIKSLILQQAAADYKDWEDSVELINLAALKKHSVCKHPTFDDQAIVKSNLKLNVAFALKKRMDGHTFGIQFLSLGDGKYRVIYDSIWGPCTKKVNLRAAPNKVEIDGQELSIDDFVREYRFKTAVTYKDLPKIFAEDGKLILEQTPPGTLLLRQSVDKQTLVILLKFGKKNIEEFRFPRSPSGKEIFLDSYENDKECTLQEIVDKYRKICVGVANEKALIYEGVQDYPVQAPLTEIMVRLMSDDPSQLYLLGKDASNRHLLYNTPTGPRIKEINLAIAPGLVQVDGEELTIRECINKFTENTAWPTYAELPDLSFDQALEILENSVVGSILLRKSLTGDPGSFVVSIRTQKESTPNSYRFLPAINSDNSRVEKYLYPRKGGKNAELSMKQIVNKLFAQEFASTYADDKSIPTLDDLPYFSFSQANAILENQPVGSMLLAKQQGTEDSIFLKIKGWSGELFSRVFLYGEHTDKLVDMVTFEAFTLAEVIKSHRAMVTKKRSKSE